jgi:dihydrofolate reductase
MKLPPPQKGSVMARVLLDMAVSLDGFAGGPGGVDVGLYDWYVNPSEVSRPVIDELIETTGVIVIRRGAYVTGEDSGGWDDTPYRVPHIVITHQPPLQPEGKVQFLFVTDGIAAAIGAAKEAAASVMQPSAAELTSHDKPWQPDSSTSCSCMLC